jgi:DNA-binding CsgD family transcriptional regulator
MMDVRNLSLCARGGGNADPSANKPTEAARGSRFVVDGHSLIAIPARRRSAKEIVSPLERNALLVGRLTCSGTRYLVYDADQMPAAAPDKEPSAADILTRRELQVALLIGDGKCDKEIARQLGISGFTVREHIRRIFAKLNIGRRSAIVSCVLGQAMRRAE